MEKTPVQKFATVTVERSALKEHPNNPRIISGAAEKRLRDKMAEVGLLQPLVVNKRTMHVIGGHQRLHQLDKLQRYGDGKKGYSLDVAMVDLPEEQELEMLVFLNNPSAQGEWDLDKLAALNLEFKVPFAAMGFDKVDTAIMFEGDPRFDALFFEPQAAKDVTRSAEEIASIKESKKAARGKFVDVNNADFYFVVVCASGDEKTALMNALGQPAWEQVVSADALKALAEKAGVSLELPAEAKPRKGQAGREQRNAESDEAAPAPKRKSHARKKRANGDGRNAAKA